MVKTKDDLSVEIRIHSLVAGSTNTVSVPVHMVIHATGKKRIIIRLGSAQSTVRLVTNNTENSIYFSEDVLDYFSCLRTISACHARVCEHIMYLGPVVGVLAGASNMKNYLQTNRSASRVAELIKANEQEKTILYFFSYSDLRKQEKKIVGAYFDTHVRKWKKGIFPYPDVLYDRGNGKYRHDLQQRNVRHVLDQSNVKKINAQHFFDKWEVHAGLSRFSSVRPHLPKTVLLNRSLHLKEICSSHPIYLKKRMGSNGREVIKIKQCEQGGGYEYSYYADQLIRQQVGHFSQLAHHIQTVFGEKQMIVQEEIRLLTVANQLVDFRATLQRIGDGSLHVVANVARLGQENSPVTSTRTGSVCYPIDWFLEHHLQLSTVQIEKVHCRMNNFLKMTYCCLEQMYGSFGEIGIDFGMDEENHLWFIECNARPAKEALYLACDQKTIKQAFGAPLQYAKYLTRF